MINLTQYIIEKFKISKNSSAMSRKEEERRRTWQDDEETNDFCDIKDILHEIEGKNSETADWLLGLAQWVDEDADIIESKLFFKFNESAYYAFIREIVNRDYIYIGENGKVDINGSNHKDIATILNKYITPDMGKKIRASFSW